MLDTGCLMLDAGYWVLDAVSWILDPGYWMPSQTPLAYRYALRQGCLSAISVEKL